MPRDHDQHYATSFELLKMQTGYWPQWCRDALLLECELGGVQRKVCFEDLR